MSNEDSSMKAHIIDCAVQLYKKHGYKNVSVSDICELSGITRSGFYYHFKSKDEILDGYLLIPEVMPSTLITENLISILDTSNYYKQFYYIFKMFMERVIAVGPEILGLIFKRDIDAGINYMSPPNVAMWDVYLALIRRAQEAGDIENSMPAEQIVEAIIFLSQGVALMWLNKNGSFDYIEKCRVMIETLVRVKH